MTFPIHHKFFSTRHVWTLAAGLVILVWLGTTSTATAQDRLPIEAIEHDETAQSDATNQHKSTKRIEAKVERMHHEDSGSRIEEVRIEGQSKSVKVQPKTIKIKPYQVDTQPENGSLINQGSNRTGKTNRSWSVFKF